MNFASLKAKAAETAKDARSRASVPSRPATKYQPVRPEDVAGQRALTPSERYAQSTVLQHQHAIHRPPPPPIRSRSGGGEAHEEKQAAPPSTPARGYGAPPPALPSRTASYASANSATSGGGGGAPPAPPPRSTPAPPYQHAVAHDLPKPTPPPRSYNPAAPAPSSLPRENRAVTGGGTEFKKFSEYDEKDKEVMFAMLDSFFEARLKGDTSRPMPQGFVAVGSTPQVVAPVPKMGESHAPSPSVEVAPPPISLSTRPSLRSTPSSTPSLPSDPSAPSYPPTTPHSSSALTLSHYLLSSPFPSPPWYSLPSSPLPPPINSRTDVRYAGSWTQTGNQKAVLGFVLFGDASCCWWKISWDISRSPGEGNEKREVRYSPIPEAREGDKLYESSEKYGPGMVAFARQAVEGGRPIARGECWDLAAEALNSVAAQLPATEEPFPSIGRTHGHWIYYCRAGGEAKGAWRGGDVYVRPGDVVEWRKVKIREVGMAQGSYSTLGDPDHTAIILSASPPTTLPTLSPTLLDTSFPLSSLISLTIAEQSPGQPPRERTYDLTTMTEGEIWIYRPVELRAYTGTSVEAVWPPPRGCLEVPRE